MVIGGGPGGAVGDILEMVLRCLDLDQVEPDRAHHQDRRKNERRFQGERAPGVLSEPCGPKDDPHASTASIACAAGALDPIDGLGFSVRIVVQSTG
ncbi:hypothetical protein GCM10009116_16930 [Brevundimonas basaltis]